jgi:O-antigen/teichoic acid export membrane protein
VEGNGVSAGVGAAGSDEQLAQTIDRDAKPPAHGDGLKQKTARGAMVAITGQFANFVLRTGSMMVMARLVSPEHFGLVNMVVAFTGFLNLFRDIGLVQATVQSEAISHEQTSTLFWINLMVGVGLAILCSLAAPLVAWFYGEPRLVWIMIALGSAFIFNGAAAQHRALLQREMKLGRLMAIEIVSLVLCIGIAIGMAVAGLGYWALVLIAACQPLLSMIGLWWSAHWRPGVPRSDTPVRSMLHYGGMVTLNGLIMYSANNLEKVLLGRFWGAEMLGLYGRAYQLINLPGENLNTTIGWVMFPALSRVQNDPSRLRNYFLKGYGLFLSLVAPITIACAIFAADIVRVMLGAQWGEAVPIFSLLAPTIIAAAVMSPLGCLMQATGRVVRSVKISLLIAPVLVLGYTLGLSRGPTGVAVGFSGAMVMLIVPVTAWARQGTLITGRDMLLVAARPVVSALSGAALAYWVGTFLVSWGAFSRLVVVSTVLFAAHGAMLLLVFRQWPEYLNMWRAVGMRRRA